MHIKINVVFTYYICYIIYFPHLRAISFNIIGVIGQDNVYNFCTRG